MPTLQNLLQNGDSATTSSRPVPARRPLDPVHLQVRDKAFTLTAEAYERAGSDSLIAQLVENKHDFAPCTQQGRTLLTGVSRRRFDLVTNFLRHQRVPTTLSPKAAEQLASDAGYLQLDALQHELTHYFPFRQRIANSEAGWPKLSAQLELGNALFAQGDWKQALRTWQGANLEANTDTQIYTYVFAKAQQADEPPQQRAMWTYHAATLCGPQVSVDLRQQLCLQAAQAYPQLFPAYFLNAWMTYLLEDNEVADKRLQEGVAAMRSATAFQPTLPVFAGPENASNLFAWRQTILGAGTRLFFNNRTASLAFWNNEAGQRDWATVIPQLQVLGKLQRHDWLASLAVSNVEIASGKGLKAVRRARRIVRKSNQHPSAALSLGLLYYECGDLRRAQVLLRSAIEQPTRFFPAWLGYGRLLTLVGRTQDAFAVLTQVYDMRPNDAGALVSLAAVVNDEGALELFSRAVTIDPNNAEFFAAYGRRLYNAGRHDEALHELKRAAALGTQVADALYMLGELYRVRDQPSRAHPPLVRALELAPYDARIVVSLAAVLVSQNAPGAQMMVSRALSLLPNDPFCQRQQLRLHVQLNRLSDAIELGDDLLHRGHDTTDVYFYLAKAVEKSGSVQIAERLWRQAIARDANDLTLSLRLLNNLVLQSRHLDAKTFGRQALVRFPAEAKLHAAYASVLFHLGDADGALSYLRMAVSLKPASGIYRQKLAACLESFGRTKEALQTYQNLSRLRPNAIDVHEKILDILRSLGREAACEEHLHVAIAASPTNLELYVWLAQQCMDTLHYDRAEAVLQRALEQDPDDAYVRRAMVRLLVLTNRSAQARIKFSDDASLALLEALQYGARRNAGDVRGAELARQAGLAVFADAESTDAYISEFCMATGHYASAYTLLQELDARDQESQSTERDVFHLGLCAQLLGRWQEAEVYYRAAQVQAPHSVVYLPGLYAVLAAQDKRAEARSLARDMLHLHPEASVVWEFAALDLLCQGRAKEASALYAEAAIKFPDEHALRLGLVRMQRLQNCPTRAWRLLQRFEPADGVNELADLIRERAVVALSLGHDAIAAELLEQACRAVVPTLPGRTRGSRHFRMHIMPRNAQARLRQQYLGEALQQRLQQTQLQPGPQSDLLPTTQQELQARIQARLLTPQVCVHALRALLHVKQGRLDAAYDDLQTSLNQQEDELLTHGDLAFVQRLREAEG